MMFVGFSKISKGKKVSASKLVHEIGIAVADLNSLGLQKN